MNDEATPRHELGDSAPVTHTFGGEPRAAASATASFEQTPFWRRTHVIAITVLAVVLLVAVVAIVRYMRAGSGAGDADNAGTAPLVTVKVPGRSTITTLVSFTGGIVARYDMPIGVEGDGGRQEWPVSS